MAAAPVVILSIASAVNLYRSTVEINTMRLNDRATYLAARVQAEIAEASKIARLLAALPRALNLADGCTPAFYLVVERFASADVAALIRPDGTIACRIGGDAETAETLFSPETIAAGSLVVRDRSAVIAAPMEGNPGWNLAVSWPLAYSIADARNGEDGFRVAAVRADGSAVRGAVPDFILPTAGAPDRNGAAAITMALETGTGILTDREGTVHRIAIKEIAASGLYAIAFRPDADILADEAVVLIGAVTSPLLMIGFTVLAAWFGIDRMVLRWIDYLRRITAAYGGGRSSVRAFRLEHAPTELAELGAAFNEMAEAVGERTILAETAARERGYLLRELHHRIKNNFQIVASLLALQRREASPQVAEALAIHERRVAALAIAYRVSYAQGDVGLVALGTLLTELCEIMARTVGRPWARIDLDLAPNLPDLPLDRAVPAALLVTKLTDMRISRSPVAISRVEIKARLEGKEVTIDVLGQVADTANGKMSTRLRDAFVMQLGAQLDEAPDGSRSTILFHVGDEPTGGGISRPLSGIDTPIPSKPSRAAPTTLH